jgi:hypothetical protein
LISNNIPIPSDQPITGWQVWALVKEFTAPNYGYIGDTRVPLTSAGTFTVSRPIGAGHICQYGFLVFGPDTQPGSVNTFTGAGVQVEDADPAITNQPAGRTITSGVTTNMTVGAVGSAALTYQWKTNGVNLVNGVKYSGVDTKTLTIADAQVADSGAYVVTVSNTVTGTTVDSRPAQLNVLDILISASPVNQRVEQGSTVNFSVTATSSSVLTYQWYGVFGNVTNTLSNGPGISGVTSSNLTLSNVPVTNSGTYFVKITAGAASANVGATLLVKSYADYANFLENPGFETGTDSPWVRFASTNASFGRIVTSSDTYFGGGNVNIFQGTYSSYTTYNDVYSGIYQDVVAAPGQIFTADMWFYNATGDPIPGPSMSATNENYLEVQFRAGGNVLQQYITTISNLDYTATRDVWFNLQATNAGTYGSMPPTSNAKYLVAPPGTTTVRFQLTMHDVANSVGNGSIYYDSAALMLKVPVAVSASMQGGNLVLSWKSQGSTSYQVQFKDALDADWQNLGASVPGTGQGVSKSDPAPGPSGHRFYRVLTL